MLNADLHCHSYYSDGTLPPAEVVALAAENRVELLALTDHDSTRGLSEAQESADRLGVKLLNGVEISVTWYDKNATGHVIHIVGLNIDADHPELQSALAANGLARAQRSGQIINILFELGVDIRQQVKHQIPEGGLVTRSHIARALVVGGHVKNLEKAFKKYLGKGKPAHVGGEWMSLKKAIDCIHLAGGVAIIAHPMRYRLNAMRLDALVQDFKALGGHGLEVVTATQDVNQVARCVQLAKHYQLLASVGSDFHSLEQRWAMLGRCASLPASVTPIWEAL